MWFDAPAALASVEGKPDAAAPAATTATPATNRPSVAVVAGVAACPARVTSNRWGAHPVRLSSAPAVCAICAALCRKRTKSFEGEVSVGAITSGALQVSAFRCGEGILELLATGHPRSSLGVPWASS